MQLLINISKEIYERTLPYKDSPIVSNLANDYPELTHAVANGTPLPEGHGDLIDKNDILSFLKCPKYENCDWKNCSECNQRLCIRLNNVNDFVPIIEAEVQKD